MITPYLRPQDTITQILQQAAARATSRRNPVVIGPQYDLYLNDGRDLSGAYLDFSSSGSSDLPYTDATGDALSLSHVTPQHQSAELYGRDLRALVAEFTGSPNVWSVDDDDTTARHLRISADLVAGVGTLNPALDGRPIRVGDFFHSSWDDGDGGTGNTERRVVGLLGEVTAPVVPSNASALHPFNAVSQATVDGVIATQASTPSGALAGVSTVLPASDLPVFRANGYVTNQGTGGDYRLGDSLELVFTAGAPGTSEVSITSTATGQVVTGVATTLAGGNFRVSLASLGYDATAEVVISRSGGTMSNGDRVRVVVSPQYTAAVVGNVTVAGSYVAATDRRYAVEVLAAGTSNIDVRVYDLAGGDLTLAFSNVLGSPFALCTSGLTATLVNTPGIYYKGQIFYVDVVAARVSAERFDGVILDGPAVPAATMAAHGGHVTFTRTDVLQTYTGRLDSSNTLNGADPALVASASDWSYASNLGLPNEVTGRAGVDFSPFQDARGSVVLSFKALVIPKATESLVEIDREIDILSQLGSTHTENWLARGALEAFNGNQKRVVYALRTEGTSTEDFSKALRKIQTTDKVYALVALSDDVEVMEMFRDHCESMSDKFRKNFRRAYVGTDSPGAYTHWGALPNGAYRTGKLESSMVTLDEEFRDAWKFTQDDVGSEIVVQAIGQKYTILEHISDFEILTDAPTNFEVANTNLLLERADTPANTALFVIERSKRLGSRRIANVWCDSPIVREDGQAKVLPMKFVAAEVAGLRCALLPQQGLTMTEILSIDAAPSMFTVFDPETLDDIAANGTFVVTQESEGGDVFVRHQLTTSTTKGPLAYEDNVGVIVDEFAYAVKDEFKPYVGRRNATQDTVNEINDKLKALAADFTQAELVNRDIGPMVLAFFDEDGEEGEVTVRQDGDLADSLMTYVKLRVPLPLNGLNHFIDVEVAELLSEPAA